MIGARPLDFRQWCPFAIDDDQRRLRPAAENY